MIGNGIVMCVLPHVVICHSYESPICPNTISFTSTVFSFCSCGVTSSCVCCRGPADQLPTSGRAKISELLCYATVSFLFFIFLFPCFQVHFKGEEEPRFIYQIQQIERDKRQQESLGFFAYCQTINQQQNQRENHFYHLHCQIQQRQTSAEHAADTHRTYKY